MKPPNATSFSETSGAGTQVPPRCPDFDGDSKLRFETPLQCSSPIPGILQPHDLNFAVNC